MAAVTPNENVRYEPNDIPPPAVTIGAGAQAALVTLAPIVLTVVIVVRIADSYLSWAAFSALVVSGLTTFMQAVRLGRIGSGHILIMGTSGAFIAVCVAALVLVLVAMRAEVPPASAAILTEIRDILARMEAKR